MEFQTQQAQVMPIHSVDLMISTQHKGLEVSVWRLITSSK